MKKALILSGAGISASAGIPTFDDVLEMRDVLSIEYFSEHYEEFWTRLFFLHKCVVNAKPTLAHKLLATHSHEIITMNLDGLHTRAGSKNVIEVHGNFQKIYCTNPDCKSVLNFDFAYNSLQCPICSSKLKPDIVLYGENSLLYQKAFDTLFKYAGKDFVIIGTSFKNEFPLQMKKQAEKLKCHIQIFNENADAEVLEYLVNQEF